MSDAALADRARAGVAAGRLDRRGRRGRALAAAATCGRSVREFTAPRRKNRVARAGPVTIMGRMQNPSRTFVGQPRFRAHRPRDPLHRASISASSRVWRRSPPPPGLSRVSFQPPVPALGGRYAAAVSGIRHRPGSRARRSRARPLGAGGLLCGRACPGPGRLHDLMVTLEAVTPGELKARGAGVAIHYGFSDTPFGTRTARAYRARRVRTSPSCDGRDAARGARAPRGELAAARLARDDDAAAQLAAPHLAHAAGRGRRERTAAASRSRAPIFSSRSGSALLELGASGPTSYSAARARGRARRQRARRSATRWRPTPSPGSFPVITCCARTARSGAITGARTASAPCSPGRPATTIARPRTFALLSRAALRATTSNSLS